MLKQHWKPPRRRVAALIQLVQFSTPVQHTAARGPCIALRLPARCCQPSEHADVLHCRTLNTGPGRLGHTAALPAQRRALPRPDAPPQALRPMLEADWALRAFAATHWVTGDQAAQIVGAVAAAHREGAAVTLWGRCLDRQHAWFKAGHVSNLLCCMSLLVAPRLHMLLVPTGHPSHHHGSRRPRTASLQTAELQQSCTSEGGRACLQVMACLPAAEQVSLTRRLGISNVLDVQHPFMAYELRLRYPDEDEVPARDCMALLGRGSKADWCLIKLLAGTACLGGGRD